MKIAGSVMKETFRVFTRCCQTSGLDSDTADNSITPDGSAVCEGPGQVFSYQNGTGRT